ncbi:hypothetical protein RIF29_41731 [Crotalaria pallida]|uniref:Uncharacterized protein n=1 Tax=Crotalaria pallida TaxID=3830 RepID=A0AAN9E6B2_CROPI
MANKSILDLAITVRIVIGFLKFLTFVITQNEVADDVIQKIESLIESIKDIFKIDQTLLEQAGLAKKKEDPQKKNDDEATRHSPLPAGSPTPTTTEEQGGGHDQTWPWVILFQEFSLVMADIEFFNLSSIGAQNLYLVRTSYIQQIFYAAIRVLMDARSDYETFDRWNLADALNILGTHTYDTMKLNTPLLYNLNRNRAMRSLSYIRAIDMYSAAIALWKNNPMYFCHRGQAFFKAGIFRNAIADLHEAIRLEPRYKMAYFHIGCVYLKLGKNFEAINEGFMRALWLEPVDDVDDALAGIELAQQKIIETLSRVKEQTYEILIPRGKKRPNMKLAWITPDKDKEERNVYRCSCRGKEFANFC